MLNNHYNPDVLSCIANLSSDEVFTPPELVNQMLDLLPQELFRDKSSTFLDPACKSGVFLREIAKRLDIGLEAQIPNRQKRIDHIFTKQLFGLAITQLTSLLSRRSLYCSKHANGKYSVCSQFKNESGNIRYTRIEHTWQNGRCIYCGASEQGYDRGEELESHAYSFIHTENPEDLFKMKFDVIIGNPPYQMSDGGGTGTSAKPIYHHFVEQAKKLNPRYLCMIIPSRWFSGGKGLDEFRNSMLMDECIRQIVDYESATEVFPGVDIAGGVCYFLWDRDNKGLCSVTNASSDDVYTSIRPLNEFKSFVRNGKAIPIIRKIHRAKMKTNKFLNDRVSSRRPFGLSSTYPPKKFGVPCWFTQRVGLRYADPADIVDVNHYLDKWKLLIPFAPIAGQTDFSKPVAFYYESNTRIAKPGECCSESWLVACAFSTLSEVESFKSFLFTKIVRFMLLQAVTSQNITRQYFYLIPDLMIYDRVFTDDILMKEWGLSDDEWELIDTRIKTTNYEAIIPGLM